MTTSRDVRDGNREHITREPEQVKAFRDTWRDGIHSYLTYLRDRLTVARDLLTESGSIFVQIGDENVHRLRAVMDEVFGEDNFLSLINFQTSTGRTAATLDSVTDYLLWYAKESNSAEFRQLFLGDEDFGASGEDFLGRYGLGDLTSQHPSTTAADGRLGVRKVLKSQRMATVNVSDTNGINPNLRPEIPNRCKCGCSTRECRQISLVQRTIARIWQMAGKEAAFLA